MAKCRESPPTHATSGPGEGDLVLALQAFLHATLPAPGLRAWWLLTSFLSHDLATTPSSFSVFSPILSFGLVLLCLPSTCSLAPLSIEKTGTRNSPVSRKLLRWGHSTRSPLRSLLGRRWLFLETKCLCLLLWRFCVGELLWVRRMGCPKAVPVSAPVTCAESSSDTVIRGSLFSERLSSLDPGFRGPRETAVGFKSEFLPASLCQRGHTRIHANVFSLLIWGFG